DQARVSRVRRQSLRRAGETDDRPAESETFEIERLRAQRRAEGSRLAGLRPRARIEEAGRGDGRRETKHRIVRTRIDEEASLERIALGQFQPGASIGEAGLSRDGNHLSHPCWRKCLRVAELDLPAAIVESDHEALEEGNAENAADRM